ncbi:MAG TPA: hypothetical protein VKX17_01305 [Planctomycetota bacterium]|nr:hypothetical protein [Planctomycetota bacterium]
MLRRAANRIPFIVHRSSFIVPTPVFLILHFAFCILNSSAAERSLSDCTNCLCARHEAVQSVVARLRLTLHNVKKKQDFTLNGACLGDAAGNLRLRVTTDGGQLVLDMSARGDAVEICLPDKELFITGSRQDLLNHPRGHLTLLAHCGGARDLFFPTAPCPAPFTRIDSCRIDDRAYFNLRETPQFLARYTRRTVLDLSRSVVEQTRLFTRIGADAGRIVYSDYHFPQSSATDAKPAWPGRIALHTPGGDYVLDMDVEDLSVNTPLPLAKFTTAVPDGYQREGLAEALKRNVNIWE